MPRRDPSSRSRVCRIYRNATSPMYEINRHPADWASTGMAASPARGKLNKEQNQSLSVLVRAGEFALARQVWPSRHASARSRSTPKLNLPDTPNKYRLKKQGTFVFLGNSEQKNPPPPTKKQRFYPPPPPPPPPSKDPLYITDTPYLLSAININI